MRQSVRAVAHSAVVLVCVLLNAAAQGIPQKSNPLPSPGTIADVVCSADPNQSYSLYLPSNYTVEKRWPVIYFFDPGGRGRRPVEMYKDIAEKYGFVFAGSNNSRNFSDNQSEAVNALWRDTHMRLALDDRRVYVSGFSGGARVAGMMALSGSGSIAGVIAHGAGYPSARVGSSTDKLLYYFAIGNRDFNWPEVMIDGQDREKQGLPFRVRQYTGTHQWATPEVMEDAVLWLNLKAMQAGASAVDSYFVDQQYQRMQKEAAEAEKRNDPLGEYDAYRSMASDFIGLRDVSTETAKLDSLRQSAAFKAALKEEQSEISEQRKLEAQISPKLRDYEQGNAPDMNSLGNDIIQAIAGLKDQAAHAKTEQRRLVFSRAFDEMKVEGMENGQQEFQAHRFDRAESCFQLMREVMDDPWPVLLLAETRVALGNKKQAMKDLREAVRRGLKDPEILESDKHLDALRGESEFQKLVAEMKAK